MFSNAMLSELSSDNCFSFLNIFAFLSCFTSSVVKVCGLKFPVT